MGEEEEEAALAMVGASHPRPSAPSASFRTPLPGPGGAPQIVSEAEWGCEGLSPGCVRLRDPLSLLPAWEGVQWRFGPSAAGSTYNLQEFTRPSSSILRRGGFASFATTQTASYVRPWGVPGTVRRAALPGGVCYQRAKASGDPHSNGDPNRGREECLGPTICERNPHPCNVRTPDHQFTACGCHPCHQGAPGRCGSRGVAR